MTSKHKRTNKHKTSRPLGQGQTEADHSQACTHEQTETGPRAPASAPAPAPTATQGGHQTPTQGVQRNNSTAQHSFRIIYEPDNDDDDDDEGDDFKSLDPSHLLSTMRIFLGAKRLFDEVAFETLDLLDLIREVTTRQLKELNATDGLFLVKADLDHWKAHDSVIHQAHIRMYRLMQVLRMGGAPRSPSERAEVRSAKLVLLDAMRTQVGMISEKITFVEYLPKSQEGTGVLLQNSVRLRDPETMHSDITRLSTCHSLSIAERILKSEGLFDNLPLERDRSLARVLIQAQRTIEMVNMGLSTVMTRPADRIRERVLHNRISTAHDLMLHRLRPITTVRQEHPLILAAKPLATPKSLSKVPKEIRRRRIQMGALEAIDGLAQAAADSIDGFFDLPWIMSAPEFFDSFHVRILG